MQVVLAQARERGLGAERWFRWGAAGKPLQTSPAGALVITPLLALDLGAPRLMVTLSPIREWPPITTPSPIVALAGDPGDASDQHRASNT